MDEFDALKNSWKAQKLEDKNKAMELLKNKAMNQVNVWRKKQFWTNLGMTLSFGLVLAVIYWVWTSFPHESFAFYLGLAIMAVLLLVFLGIQWYSFQPDWEGLDKNPLAQIRKRKQKLKFNKWLLAYGTPVYMVVMLLAFYIYFFGLFYGASWEYWALSYGLTTLYFILIVWISRKKIKKQIQKIEELEAYLDQWEELM